MIAIVWNDQDGSRYRQLSPQTFADDLTWIPPSIQLVIEGVEPTQNPAVIQLCEQLISPRRYAILRTNGLFRPELRQVIMRTFSETEVLLQNPQRYSEAAWEALESHLRTFSEKRYTRVTLSVTLDDPAENFIYLLPLLRELKLYPVLRVRVAQDKSLTGLKALTPAIINLVSVAFGAGYKTVIEDLVVMCQFNTDQLDVLNASGTVFRFVGEGGWFRILPDGKLAHWDPAFTERWDRSSFPTPQLARRMLADREAQLRFVVPSFLACDQCLFWFNHVCQGGGLHRKRHDG